MGVTLHCVIVHSMELDGSVTLQVRPFDLEDIQGKRHMPLDDDCIILAPWRNTHLSLLQHTQGSEWTGNEAAPEEYIYFSAVMLVRNAIKGDVGW